MTDEELIARLRNYGHVGTVLEAADRIEALVKQVRESALQELASLGQAQEAYEAQKSAEAEVSALQAEIVTLKEREEKLRGALRDLIDHTHNCEKELTEELHGADFCGESLPLTNARAALLTEEHK